MAKDTSFEMYKGIRVTEANDLPCNHGIRLDMSKYTQLDRSLNKLSLTDQAIRDKIGKNKGWSVCKSWSDPETKTMNFQIVINAKETDIKTMNYDEICSEFKWKSFKWSEDCQMILPKE